MQGVADLARGLGNIERPCIQLELEIQRWIDERATNVIAGVLFGSLFAQTAQLSLTVLVMTITRLLLCF